MLAPRGLHTLDWLTARPPHGSAGLWGCPVALPRPKTKSYLTGGHRKLGFRALLWPAPIASETDSV